MTEADQNFGDIADDTWERLLQAALEVQQRAYAPYSEFPVGAALLCSNGEIVAGCNVENATIGATVCAERTAVGNAICQGERQFEALCVVCNISPPAAPCGICRQVLAEFGEELPIMMANREGERDFTVLKELLPRAFTGTIAGESMD